jgi:hypothetical protein
MRSAVQMMGTGHHLPRASTVVFAFILVDNSADRTARQGTPRRCIAGEAL